MNLEKKIQTRRAKLAVVGLGYVGLPLAVNFAKARFTVFGLDKDQDRVDRVNRKESYILDVSTRDLKTVVGNKKLLASTDFRILKDADVAIICVPTPLKRKYTPDISYIVGALKVIQQYLKKDMLIILESTTYPGTTQELIKPVLEESGLRAGRDFFLSFSPERIDPGNKQYDVTNITKVVGGLTPRCGQLTKKLYETIIRKIHVVSSPRAAEMTKLLENTFRIINIGWVNEVAMMCHKLDIDVWEVIDAARTKPFGFMPFYPGLGVGGHCIPDDPLYLFWKARHHGFSSKFIKLSADINASMPQYALDWMTDVIRQTSSKKLNRIKVLVVGVTYKKDVKDLRKSPALKLLALLQKRRMKIAYHDPIIPYLDFASLHMFSTPLTAKNVSSVDAVIIATDHTRVDYGLIARHGRRVFDMRNVYKNVKKKNIFRL